MAQSIPIIRPAHPEEHDDVARVWMNSWVSTGLAEKSEFLLANLRARVPHEIDKGWSLYVADADGQLAAMLALHLPKRYLDQLFVAPEYQGQSLGRQLLAFSLRTNASIRAWLRRNRLPSNASAWPTARDKAPRSTGRTRMPARSGPSNAGCARRE